MRPRLFLAAALGIAAAIFLVRLYLSCSTEFAWDFAINWTAANALRAGVPLYDGAAMRQLGLTGVGPAMRSTFTSPYTSYIGPPTTALLYLPFTWLAFPIALGLYRGLTILIFGLAVLVAGYSLPAEDRQQGWLWGAFALLLFDPVNLSIWIGQVDAWVILALAVTLWAYRSERWCYAGIAAGAATLLKVSPGVLIVYFLLRRRYMAAAAAIVTMIALLGAAYLAGGAANLRTFALVVAPTLSFGSLYAENQSLPAYLARLFTQESDFNTYTVGIGAYRLLSFGIAGMGVLALWYHNRRRPEHGLTVPILILIALLMGPITWDHYASWALVPLISMAERRLWAGHSARARQRISLALLIGAVLLAVPTFYLAPAAVEQIWWLRLLTGAKTVGLMLWSGVAISLLLPSLSAQPAPYRSIPRVSAAGQVRAANDDA